MIRLYFNLTNKCNEECEFCCMYSSKTKNTFLDFDKYKEIVDKHCDDFELQLEGGEPFLHKDFYLFIYYALKTERCKKIIICTNGKLLESNLNRLVDICKYKNIPITIKPSINYWLINKNKKLIKQCRDIYFATEFIDNFDIRFNVRLRKEDEWIVKELEKNRIKNYSNIFYLQSYGRLSDDTRYDKPVIVQNIDNWFIYASDGSCFNKDLISRSEYERG